MLDTGRPVDKIHREVKIDFLKVSKKHKSKVGEKDAASSGKYQSPICSLKKNALVKGSLI